MHVICGVRNHQLQKTLVVHPYAGRLSKHEKKFLTEMAIVGVKPKNVLYELKACNKANTSTMRTIYNAKAKMGLHVMDGRSAMQQLMKIIVDNYHVY